jgi:hypothetical protein
MDEAGTEVVDSGPKRDTRGRRVTDRARREQLLEAYDQSGLTQKLFARREGINYNTFVSWLMQRRHWQPSAVRDQHASGFVELALPQGASGAQLEVVLPGGLIVRGRDASAVAVLVRALRP